MTSLVLLVLSQGNSGGDDGGLDVMRSSEKIALSLGIGVDDMLAANLDARSISAMSRMCAPGSAVRIIVAVRILTRVVESDATGDASLKC